MGNVSITVDLSRPGARVDPNLFGHFVEHLGGCVYDGIWVGPESTIPNDGGVRTDVVEAMRRIRPPVVRWPGGNFADDYDWEDGVGPPAERPVRVNQWWGGLESNQFGTHEFIHFCRLIGAEPYLAGNVGSETPRKLRNWVEYCNFEGDSTLARRRSDNGSTNPFGVRYWGVGNENWGAGGAMTGDEYAAAYRRYSTLILREQAGENPLRLIACGPPGDSQEWTRLFFEGFHRPDPVMRWSAMWGFAPHYYTYGEPQGVEEATGFSSAQWYALLSKGAGIERMLLEQRAILDEFDPERRISLVIDEWGSWHKGPHKGPTALWQQNTIRDALLAALTLDAFVRHADIVAMANIAQLVNVLQSLLMTEGDRMLLTPTYHVYDMYKGHQGGDLVELKIDAGDLSVKGATTDGLRALAGAASVRDGVLTLSIVNPHLDDAVEATVDLGGAAVSSGRRTQLTGDAPDAHNTFEAPDRITPAGSELVVAGGKIAHIFPPASVTVFTLTLG